MAEMRSSASGVRCSSGMLRVRATGTRELKGMKRSCHTRGCTSTMVDQEGPSHTSESRRMNLMVCSCSSPLMRSRMPS